MLTTMISRIIVYGLLILLLISVVFNVIQHVKLDISDSKVASLTLANTTLSTDLKNCNSKVNEQNAAIKDAGEKSKQQQTDMNNLGNQLADQQKKNKELIDKLVNQTAPKTCDDAVKYLQDALKDYK